MLPRIRGSFTGNIEPTVIAEQNPDGRSPSLPVAHLCRALGWSCNEIGIVPNSTALLPFSSRRQRSRGVSVPSTASDTSSLGPIPSSLTPLTRPHECGGAWPTADVASSAPEAGELLSHVNTKPCFSQRGRSNNVTAWSMCSRSNHVQCLQRSASCGPCHRMSWSRATLSARVKPVDLSRLLNALQQRCNITSVAASRRDNTSSRTSAGSCSRSHSD
mmetsp:Transcript_39326/g.116998  ORF Transcript_39326/g.116998 Transcript_39326/m.116998 type:complete len:217 (-) Transcript_39326:342-992(-)